MKKFSKKSAVLFAGVMMVCAFAVPSMASAATWAPNNTAHTLHSTNLGFVAHTTSGLIGSSCATSTFSGDVGSAFITITNATFTNCTGTSLLGSGCTVVPTPTRLPWRATPLSATNVTIDGVHIDVRFSGSCLANGLTSTLTGNLGGGAFNNTSHHLTLDNDLGLISHTPGATSIATVSGTIRDVQQTLVLN